MSGAAEQLKDASRSRAAPNPCTVGSCYLIPCEAMSAVISTPGPIDNANTLILQAHFGQKDPAAVARWF
jgi:hypothetical protein